MTYELGRSLLLSDAVSPEALAEALCTAASERVSLVRALLSTRAIDPDRLEEELARSDAPMLRHVTPVLHLMEQLPPGLCARLLAVPVRRDPRTGTVDVAVADARDSHAAEEIAFFLRSPVRLVRAPLSAIEDALGRPFAPQPVPAGVRALAAPMITPPPPAVRSIASTPLWGTPVANLDDFDRRDVDRRSVSVDDSGWSIPPETLEEPRSHEQQQAQEQELEPPISEAPAFEIPIPLSRRAIHVDVREPDHHGLAEVVESAFAPLQPFAPAPSSVFPASRRLVLTEQEQDEEPTEHAEEEEEHYEREETAPYPSPRLELADQVDEEEDGDEEGDPIVELRRTKSAPKFDTAELRAKRVEAILREIEGAPARDELLALLLEGARTVTRKAALFVVKRDGYVGWACTSEFGDVGALRAMKVDPRAPTFLARAASAGSYAGAVLPSEANAPLLDLLDSEKDSVDVACAAVRPGGRTAVIIVTYDLTEPLAAIVQLEEIAAAGAEAFERILLTRR